MYREEEVNEKGRSGENKRLKKWQSKKEERRKVQNKWNGKEGRWGSVNVSICFCSFESGKYIP